MGGCADRRHGVRVQPLPAIGARLAPAGITRTAGYLEIQSLFMYRIPFDRVNWITSSFLIGTALIALVGLPIYLVKFGIDWFQFGMFFFYLVATMMSITVGYHRLFSHLSFKAKLPVRLVHPGLRRLRV